MTAPSFTKFCSSVGVRLLPAQKVFWSVACGEVQPCELDGAERALAAQIFGPDVDEVPEEALGVVALVKGADVGASFVGGLHSEYCAVTAERGDAAAGEVRPGLVVGPDLRLGRVPVRAAKGAAARMPDIEAIVESETADSIVFRREGGWFSSVECLPASAGGRATRGRRYLDVKLDEASFFRDGDSGQVNDVHVFESVVARCLGTVWLMSTPWLESSLIWKLYEENFGHPVTALAAKLPTLLVRTNARTRAMVERARALDPDSAAREFDCEVHSGSASAFFPAEAIERAFDNDLQPFFGAA